MVCNHLEEGAPRDMKKITFGVLPCEGWELWETCCRDTW